MPKYKKEGIKTSTVGVVLPEDLKIELEKEANSRGWSLSQTAALAIKEWLNTLKVK